MDSSRIERAGLIAGIGMVAGLVGAAAMNLSQHAEMALTHRDPSPTPAKAIERLGAFDLPDKDAEARLSTAGHYAFGSALGLGLAAMDDVAEPARTGLFLAGAWGAGTALIAGLGVSDPPTRWTAKQLAIDIGHHAVYATAAAATFVYLRRLIDVAPPA